MCWNPAKLLDRRFVWAGSHRLRPLGDKIEPHAVRHGGEASATGLRSGNAGQSHLSAPYYTPCHCTSARAQGGAIFGSWKCHISRCRSGSLPRRRLPGFQRQNAVKASLQRRPEGVRLEV